MKKKLVILVEEYLFNPNLFTFILSFALLPLSLVYFLIVFFKYKTAKEQSLGLPVISIGNLIVGGSGKTPLTITLAREHEKSAIVLRGYGRSSKGLKVVSHEGSILCDVKESGDEAMLYALSLINTSVIVSEDRVLGILKAKELGAKVVFLDDGYSKHFIKKLDIVINAPQKNPFCLPSGPFREKLWQSKKALVIEEEKDFIRHVSIEDATENMLLVTAISKPKRLNKYLPNVINKVYFPDHYEFVKEELEVLIKEHKASSLLVTEKDYVKIAHFGLPLSLMKLSLELKTNLQEEIKNYIKGDA